jgi:hypothetical protein
MTINELEERWRSVVNTGSTPFRSLLISAETKQDLYLGIDPHGRRYLILHVPSGLGTPLEDTKLENISLEWHDETNYVMIGLLKPGFTDLYNELSLSIYNRIKDIEDGGVAVYEFISSFHRWVDFFEDISGRSLTDLAIKGLFGELTVLKWLLDGNSPFEVNDILAAWMGPFGRSHDFIFQDTDTEVKTKSPSQVLVHIASEFQLQMDRGKELKLCVVDAEQTDSGKHIVEKIEEVKSKIRDLRGETGLFVKALSQAGIRADSEKYNHLRFRELSLSFYQCGDSFPAITSVALPAGIRDVRYNLDTTILETFLTEKIIF